LPEVICNTSPLQYLHQLGLLHVLPALAGQVVVPPAVVDELAEGERNEVIAQACRGITVSTSCHDPCVPEGKNNAYFDSWSGRHGQFVGSQAVTN